MVANIEILGWIGAVLLATCGLPQLYTTLKTKNFEGLSITFMIWWLAGEVLTLAYVTQVAFRWPLIFNYALNIIIPIIILSLFFIAKKKNKKKK
jgi:uncharacterized protein with PQ loop repeat